MTYHSLLGMAEPPVKPLSKNQTGRATTISAPPPKKVSQVSNAVSITWLSKVFRLPRYKVISALVDCPVLKTSSNGAKLYDLATAARYLVDPVTDLDAYLQTIKASSLPEKLRETFWNAKIKEAKYRVMAGELWPTQRVMEVLSETFKTLKKTTQLWADTIEEDAEALTIKQRAVLTTLVDRLLDEMHTNLVKQANENETESYLKDLDDEIN